MNLVHSPSDKIIRLKELMATAAENYFERISLACDLLTDRAWIDEAFKGDQHKAAQALEDQYFHDLCGLLTIWNLIHIYQKFPNKTDWKKHGYNLRKMFDKCRESKKTKREYTVAERVKKTEYDALADKLEDLQDVIKEKDQTIAKLQKDLEKAERKNQTMHDRLVYLEGILKDYLPKSRTA